MHEQTERLFYNRDEKIDRKTVFATYNDTKHPHQTLSSSRKSHGHIRYHDEESSEIIADQMTAIVDCIVYTEFPAETMAEYSVEQDKEFLRRRTHDLDPRSIDHKTTLIENTYEWLEQNVDILSLASVTNLTEDDIHDTLYEKMRDEVNKHDDWEPQKY
jgi:hypothetical protein